jgi:RNA polymerase sigma-70 factor (ECF subfamily)
VVVEVDDFCHHEYPRLYGTLRLYCGDVWLAEELAQEALARAVRHWANVVRMDAPGAWVHRVAINLANSWFRRSAAERRALRRAPVRDSHEEPDNPTIIAVRQAVADLPARQREVVILRFFHDLPVRAAAERMDCAEGTVKGLLSDAIRSLRMRGLVVSDDD